MASEPGKVIDDDARRIAASLPVGESNEGVLERIHAGEPERIPLSDIVITAIEHHEFQHFRVRAYDPDADGLTAAHAWAVVEPLPSALSEGQNRLPVLLWEQTVRRGVELYLDDRLTKGMSLEDAQMMVDGVYTDVLVCDSIIQFILYGEEVLG